MEFEFIKHIGGNYISYIAISKNGMYIRVTIRSYYIDQIVGCFDKDKDENERDLYIKRMAEVGHKVPQEEFEEVQQFFVDNSLKFLTREINEDVLRKFVNEHNYVEKGAPDYMKEDDSYMFKFEDNEN